MTFYAERPLGAVQQNALLLRAVRPMAAKAGDHLPGVGIVHSRPIGMTELAVLTVALLAEIDGGGTEQFSLG